ncbi:MAG: HNH endonuclease [bacterium]|nr:HNH endonuclease [bacterium]
MIGATERMHPEDHRKLSALRYRCHVLRAQLWDLDDRRERFEAHRWVQGHIGESLKTASLEELEKLAGYLAYKLEHGHCPIHEHDNAAIRYKRDGGSSRARLKLKEVLIARDGDRCVACNATGVPLTLDHIHPIAFGGTNELSNAQLLCIPCHTKKTRGDSRRADRRYFAEKFPEKLAKRRAAARNATTTPGRSSPVGRRGG